MGIYIDRGPVQGKAQYILSEFGGRRTTLEDLICGDAFSKTIDEVVVCVVRNREFDAALVIPPVPKHMVLDNKEFLRCAWDERPKTWLMVPFKNLPLHIRKYLEGTYA